MSVAAEPDNLDAMRTIFADHLFSVFLEPAHADVIADARRA